MQLTKLDHVRIKQCSKWSSSFPNRAIYAYCDDVAVIRRVSGSLVQSGSETNTWEGDSNVIERNKKVELSEFSS